MGTNDASKLFETPAGIRIIDGIGPSCESTVAFEWPEDGLAAGEDLFVGFDPEALVHNTRQVDIDPTVWPAAHRSAQLSFRSAATSRGALFIYALLALTLNLGVLALAFTWRDSRVIAGCFVITPFTVTWFFLRLRAWLNRSTYVYRLMSSLGEDAENLSTMSLCHILRTAVASIYN